MIVVSGKIKVASGALDQARTQMETVINATRAENGCIDYSYGVDVLDPDTIIILEYWESWEALQAHFTAPHMGPWGEAMGKFGILESDIKAVEAGETRQLLGGKPD